MIFWFRDANILRMKVRKETIPRICWKCHSLATEIHSAFWLHLRFHKISSDSVVLGFLASQAEILSESAWHAPCFVWRNRFRHLMIFYWQKLSLFDLFGFRALWCEWSQKLFFFTCFCFCLAFVLNDLIASLERKFPVLFIFRGVLEFTLIPSELKTTISWKTWIVLAIWTIQLHLMPRRKTMIP